MAKQFNEMFNEHFAENSGLFLTCIQYINIYVYKYIYIIYIDVNRIGKKSGEKKKGGDYLRPKV